VKGRLATGRNKGGAGVTVESGAKPFDWAQDKPPHSKEATTASVG
jgi:hypothetical protein